MNKLDETLSTIQPFEFTKDFESQLKKLDLLGTLKQIKDHGYAVMDAGVTEEFNKKLREEGVLQRAVASILNKKLMLN